MIHRHIAPSVQVAMVAELGKAPGQGAQAASGGHREQADGSVAGVEIKAGATVATSDFTALQALRDQLGAQFHAGVVLYLGDHVVPFGDKLWLMPLSALWAPWRISSASPLLAIMKQRGVPRPPLSARLWPPW